LRVLKLEKMEGKIVLLLVSSENIDIILSEPGSFYALGIIVPSWSETDSTSSFSNHTGSLMNAPSRSIK
jgi:hypothetical protein